MALSPSDDDQPQFSCPFCSDDLTSLPLPLVPFGAGQVD